MTHDTSSAAARAAKNTFRARYRNDARVNGIGIGGSRDHHTVRVNVVDDATAAELPDEVDGVPVEKVVVGRISASS